MVLRSRVRAVFASSWGRHPVPGNCPSSALHNLRQNSIGLKLFGVACLFTDGANQLALSTVFYRIVWATLVPSALGNIFFHSYVTGESIISAISGRQIKGSIDRFKVGHFPMHGFFRTYFSAICFTIGAWIKNNRSRWVDLNVEKQSP
jgi:uncharacterized membrane protein YdcZ (DUF606 family)